MVLMTMPRFSALVFSIVALFFSCTAAKAAPFPPQDFTSLVAKVMPAVVNISTTQKTTSRSEYPYDTSPSNPLMDDFKKYFDQLYPEGNNNSEDSIPQNSLGSGFIIDPTGYIVTNYHVVTDADEIIVTVGKEEQYKAKLIGRDSKTDLALIKINAHHKLPYVTFGNSDSVKVGEWVIAIGNPFGLGESVSAGIISARARDINSGPFDDFIQTDAAINRGNSGGPLFDLNGKVIGINTAIYSPSGGSVGIGFAVPAALAAPVIEQLKAKGKVERAWLGVKVQNVTDDIAESIGMKNTHGALVVDVTRLSPADKAGLIPGDVITSFNGQEILEMKKLPRLVAETSINSTAEVALLRKGSPMKLQVKLGTLLDNDVGEPATNLPDEEIVIPDTAKEILGLTIAPLDSSLRLRYGIPTNIKGLLVMDVNKKSKAATKGVVIGDVIASANQEAVEEATDLIDILKRTKKEHRPSILLRVIRNGEARFIALPIN